MGKLSSEDQTMGMLPHLLGLVGQFMGGFMGFIGPLVIFLIKKDKKGFAYENAKHALNFQLSLLIYYVVSLILMIVLIGFVMFGALWIFAVVVGIVGSVKAYEGNIYKYPLEIPFIK